MADNKGLQEQRMIVPVPDPTLLTTAALKLSIDNLKELIFTRLDLQEKRRLEFKEQFVKWLECSIAAQSELLKQKAEAIESATAKSESNFIKQIEAIAREADLGRETLSEKVNALKERIDRGGGREEQKTLVRDTASWFIPMMIVGAIAFCSLLLQIFKLIATNR